MGNKSSKSVNISTPKGEVAVVADENNHVGNGDPVKNEGNHITLEVRPLISI
jgi:hypothetical protein